MRQVYDHAHRLLDFGYSPVAVIEKAAIHPGWQTLQPTHSDIDEWFAEVPYLNVGIHAGASSICVFDADSDRAKEWCRVNLPQPPWFQRTPRGGLHIPLYDPEGEVPIRVNLFQIGLDTRSKASYIVSSPSYSRKHRRPWVLEGTMVRPEELPRVPKGLISVQPYPKPNPRFQVDNGSDFDRAIRYAASPKTPGAISGQGGHNRTIWLASRLLVLFPSLTFDQFVLALKEFNLKCEPMWSEKEISHKAESAWKRRQT